MIPVYFCKNKSVINFTTDDMTYKFEFFSKNKMNNLYITKIMRACWMHMLDYYWDEKDIPYSDDHGFWADWVYNYSNELLLGEDIKSAYLTYKS